MKHKINIDIWGIRMLGDIDPKYKKNLTFVRLFYCCIRLFLKIIMRHNLMMQHTHITHRY